MPRYRSTLTQRLMPCLCHLLLFPQAHKCGCDCVQVLPSLVKLFSSSDRAIRIALLQNMETFASAIDPTLVDEQASVSSLCSSLSHLPSHPAILPVPSAQIFVQISSGFSDTSAFLRELTLKSMLILVPKVGPFCSLLHCSPPLILPHPAVLPCQLSQRTLTGPMLKFLSKLQVCFSVPDCHSTGS